MSNLYLYLNIFTLLGPLLLSFDKRVAFYKRWKSLFPAIVCMAIVFIAWDMAFTKAGVWGFNSAYLTGIKIYNLPLEEVLFFFTVPYACVFIYECSNYYIKADWFGKSDKLIALALGLILFGLGLIAVPRLYTSITFCGVGVYLLLHVMVFQSNFLGRFFMAYFISLIPFLMVNGILTGSKIEGQVVWYNSDHILNLRLFTIPIEDTMYNLFMLLMTIHFYEVFLKKRFTDRPLER